MGGTSIGGAIAPIYSLHKSMLKAIDRYGKKFIGLYGRYQNRKSDAAYLYNYIQFMETEFKGNKV